MANHDSLISNIASILHFNMLVDPGNLSRLRVKLDVLYKPLLRGFRSYYRAQLDE